MRIRLFFLTAFLALCSLPALAGTGTSDSALLIRMFSPMNTFNLFGRENSQDFAFHSAKTMKFCDTRDKDAVNLWVTHGNSKSLLTPGTCSDYTARNFKIRPAQHVSQNYDLVGKIDHLKG